MIAVLWELEGKLSRTSCANMREDDPHGSAVEDSLHEAIATLIWHSHEGRDSQEQSSSTE